MGLDLAPDLAPDLGPDLRLDFGPALGVGICFKYTRTQPQRERQLSADDFDIAMAGCQVEGRGFPGHSIAAGEM